jgi:16S rRNA (uracil1498-N3)-methyltransferase
MTRIFLAPEQLTSDEIVITGDNARHLAVVLRFEAGDSFEVLDGEGYKYRCAVKKTHKKEIVAEIINKEPCSVESPVAVTLGQGIARGEKMDLIIQKSIELGVQKIIPVMTERSQVRNTKKLDRWKKIASSAAEQSGRDRVPEILAPETLNDFLVTPPALPLSKGRKQDGVLKLIFYESYNEQNLKTILKAEKNIKHILLLIGPEGGFSDEEITCAIENGFIEVSLGPRILRTETAPITAISIIQYELGDMG